MLYHLFHALEEYDLPGGRLFEYITFRSGLALVLSLFIAIVFGKKIIERLPAEMAALGIEKLSDIIGGAH